MIAFEIEKVGSKWYWIAVGEGADSDIYIESGDKPTRNAAHAELERVIEACRTGDYVIEDAA